MPRARGRAADQEEASVFAKRDSLHVLTALSLLQELAELQKRFETLANQQRTTTTHREVVDRRDRRYDDQGY